MSISELRKVRPDMLIDGFYTKDFDSFLQNIKQHYESTTSTTKIKQTFLYDNGIYKRPPNNVLQNTDGVTLYNTPTYPTAAIYNRHKNIISNPFIFFSDTKNNVNFEPTTLIKRINDSIDKIYLPLHKDESFWFKFGGIELTHDSVINTINNAIPIDGRYIPLGCAPSEQFHGLQKCNGGKPRKPHTKNKKHRSHPKRKTSRRKRKTQKRTKT